MTRSSWPCEAIVYRDAPLGGGGATTCDCRGFTPDQAAAETCGLWGCGKNGTTPITVEHPDWGTWKVILVCDYHSTMVRDAE